MSAFVIDEKKKRQYLAVFVVSIIISFILGFTSGYLTNLSPSSQSYDQLKFELFGDSRPASDDPTEQPVVDEQNSAEDDSEKADEKSETEEKEVQGETPVKKAETGAKDTAPEKKSPAVNQPAVAARADKSASPAGKANTPPVSRPVTKPKPKPSPPPVVKPKPRPAPEPVPAPQPESEPAEKPAVVQVDQPGATTRPAEANPAPTRPPVSDTGKLPVAYVPEAPTSPPAPVGPEDAGSSAGDPGRYYAVQVGMFANRDNAQKLMYDLVDEGYDAYMDEFTASDGELKYNVRFGRYADRASVQGRLADYKRQYASPAYIIITQ